MGVLPRVKVTDEDLILEAPADFAILCPKDQRLAWGVDGFFAPEARWTLQSAGVDFEGQGLEAGNVVQLLGPSASFRPPGEALVVERVSGKTVVLRRKGEAEGVGQPPGPVEGLAGVEFVVTTLGPQVERVVEDVERRLGVEVAGLVLTESDEEAVRGVVVKAVLSGQYLAMSRDSGTSPEGFMGKAGYLRAQVEERLARLVVHVGGGGVEEEGARSVSRFSTRIGR